MIVTSSDVNHATSAISYVNSGFTGLIGRSADEVVGRSLHVLASAITEPLGLARLIDAIEGHRGIDLTLQIEAADDRAVWTQVQGRPLAGENRPYMVYLREVTPQRAMVATAQAVERCFDALAYLTSDSVYHLRVDPDCRLVLAWTAGAFERLTGYSAAEIDALGGWTVLVEPEDLRILQRRAQKLLAGEQTSAEYRIKSRDGARHWLRETCRPEWDQARDLVVGGLCVAQDITERRGLEGRLLVQQHERRSLISLTDGLVCEIDGEGRLTTVGGHTEGELAEHLRTSVGRRLQEVIGSGHAATWQRQIERLVPGWAPVPFALSYPAGDAEEHYEVRLCAAADGAVLALVQLRSRLSSHGEPARSDVEPDARLRALLELQRSAAVLLAPGLTVSQLNDQVEQVTGWERASAIGRPFVELMGLAREQPALQQDLELARSGIRVTASEAWLRLPDGREGRLLWNYIPLLGPEGQLYGVLAQGSVRASDRCHRSSRRRSAAPQVDHGSDRRGNHHPRCQGRGRF